LKYHSVKIVDAYDWGRVLGDFLVKAVAEVVGRVGRDEKNFPVLMGDEGSQTAAGGGLADTSFASNKDPSQ
jgi:hypothetical protein